MTKHPAIHYSRNAAKCNTMRAQRAYVLHHVHRLPAWQLAIIKVLHKLSLV